MMESFEKLDTEFHFSNIEEYLQYEIFENPELIDFFSKPTAVEVKIEKYTDNNEYLFLMKIECKSDLKKLSSDRAEILSDLISDSFFEFLENKYGENAKEKLLKHFGGSSVIFNGVKVY